MLADMNFSFPPVDSATTLPWLLFVMLIGACVGSFLNVCIYRIPLEMSVVAPRSHCPACKTLIPGWRNIPLLSWVLLGGKCHACKAKISMQYFVVEALTAILFGLVFLQWDALPQFLHLAPKPGILLPVYMVFAASLVCATFIDLEHYILPDRITIGGTVAGLALSPLLPQLQDTAIWHVALLRSVLGAACGFGVLYAVSVVGRLVFRKDAMGFGDVKLMAFFGALFGWQVVPFVLFGASAMGSVVGIALILMKRRDKGGVIPFGPFLCLAALAWLFWGPVIWDWYWGFFRPR
jgi:leader peptidase (prepilin peptidase)/N-methyltransferase